MTSQLSISAVYLNATIYFRPYKNINLIDIWFRFCFTSNIDADILHFLITSILALSNITSLLEVVKLFLFDDKIHFGADQDFFNLLTF